MKQHAKKLALATSAALLMGAAGVSQADELLFPYVVNSPSVGTVVSVVNRGVGVNGLGGAVVPAAAAIPGNQAGQLHYRLYTKAGNSPTGACVESNAFYGTSPNDVQVIDLGSKFVNNNGVMFNDPSPWNAGLTWAMLANVGDPVNTGYLSISNDLFGAFDNAGAFASALHPQLYGEAMMVEFATGAAWGYRNKGVALSNPSVPGFSLGWVRNLSPEEPVTVLPSNFDTRYFVTALGPNMSSLASGSAYTGTVRVSLGGNPASNPGMNGGVVHWNRNEIPVSGSAPIDVTCVGAVNHLDLMTVGARNFLGGNGGWTFVNTRAGVGGPNALATGGALTGSVIKLEFGDVGNLGGQAQAGTFNTALPLWRDPLALFEVILDFVDAGTVNGPSTLMAPTAPSFTANMAPKSINSVLAFIAANIQHEIDDAFEFVMPSEEHDDDEVM